MTILVTGAAGFIGAHLVRRLLADGEHVVGVDNLNNYYDPGLKRRRLSWIRHERFGFRQMDVADPLAFAAVVNETNPDVLVHLAAQPGVRYSLENAFAYERANVAGHLSVLEAVRHSERQPQLLYASSSSVYGDRPLDPGRGFHEDDPVDSPASLYAATKRTCELLSGTYARLYRISSTGLRFFTVYGPYGRPDMAYFSFTERMLQNQPIEVYGAGAMARDFTYIDDIVDGIVALIQKPPLPGEHRLFNIGDSHPRGLLEMIAILERLLGVEAKKRFLPMQPGDVTATFADVSALHSLVGYSPKVSLEEGLSRFVNWWRAGDG